MYVYIHDTYENLFLTIKQAVFSVRNVHSVVIQEYVSWLFCK